MAVQGYIYVDAVAAESGRNPPVSKYQSMENEWGDAGRDSRTCLERPNSQARTGTDREKYIFPCSADHKHDWQL